jgi:glycine cleavage system aminomethyltransferase T
MVQFQLTDPEPMLFHNEAVVRDGEIVSIVTSGNYGHAPRRRHRHGLRALPRRDRAEDVLASTYEIEVAGCAARGQGQPCAAL